MMRKDTFYFLQDFFPELFIALYNCKLIHMNHIYIKDLCKECFAQVLMDKAALLKCWCDVFCNKTRILYLVAFLYSIYNTQEVCKRSVTRLFITRRLPPSGHQGEVKSNLLVTVSIDVAVKQDLTWNLMTKTFLKPILRKTYTVQIPLFSQIHKHFSQMSSVTSELLLKNVIIKTDKCGAAIEFVLKDVLSLLWTPQRI